MNKKVSEFVRKYVEEHLDKSDQATCNTKEDKQ